MHVARGVALSDRLQPWLIRDNDDDNDDKDDVHVGHFESVLREVVYVIPR